AHAAGEVSLDRPMPERTLTCTPHQLRHEHQSVREHEVGRALHVRDLAKEAALTGEDLDTVALAIAYEHVARRVDRDAVRQHELPGARSRLAPRREQLSRRREAV